MEKDMEKEKNMNGKLKIYHDNGKIHYEGEFLNENLHGKGKQ